MIKKIIGFTMLAGVSISYTTLLILGIIQNYRASLAVVISCAILVGIFENFSDSLKAGGNNE